MQVTNGFLRTSSSGKLVGVLKYKDATGKWRQKTRTFTHDRVESLQLLALWRAELTGECIAWPIASPASTPTAPAVPAAPTAPAASAASPVAASPAVLAAMSTAPAAAPATASTAPATASPALAPFPPVTFQTIESAVRATLATQLARGRIEASTHDTQLAYAERSLFPELGTLPLAALTPAVAQAWIDRMCLQMAAGSVRIAYSTLHKTCAQAVMRGALPSNPLDRVEPPSRTRPTRAYLPPDSVALLNRTVDEQWGPASAHACAVRLALYAGLRAGEACALRWRDVDLASGRLRVAASIGRAGGGLYLKGPKCAASARDFPIMPTLARALELRVEHVGNAREHFVCGDGERFANPQSLSIAFARLCTRAGVTDNNGKRATFHVLRHTFATRAVHAGVDVRTLADLMGHARADVTLNVYAASNEDAKRAATLRMERECVSNQVTDTSPTTTCASRQSASPMCQLPGY